jgi:2-dehydro-3-deoxyphosphogluconate aldolase / (4S)-4-hydroxy-2-oxoglutarate aldolase
MTFEQALRRARVLAILRRSDIGEVVLDLFDELHGAGVRAIEVTLDQTDSLDALRRLIDHASDDVLVGAGTVLTTEQLDAVAGLGVSFVVCPHFDAQLVAHAVDRGLPILPGVATATEAAAARAAGASVLKLFPAGPLGLDYLRALRGPFRDVPFVPTGGIRVTDVPAWLAAGAACVGIGGALVGPHGVDPQLSEVLAA